jgi:hypothetical protein
MALTALMLLLSEKKDRGSLRACGVPGVSPCVQKGFTETDRTGVRVQIRSPSFLRDVSGERLRQPFHRALPFRSSQRLAHVGRARHFQPGREPSARRHRSFPHQLPQRTFPGSHRATARTASYPTAVVSRLSESFHHPPQPGKPPVLTEPLCPNRQCRVIRHSFSPPSRAGPGSHREA